MTPKPVIKSIIQAFDKIRLYYLLLKKERFFKIFSIFFIVVAYGALAIFFADRYYASDRTGGIFDAIYWAIVTVTTVGYGDMVPKSSLAKVFALMIILSGPAILSLFTASVASIFVERKIREGKGLESVKVKNHIVICGWNENGEKVIDGIILQSKGNVPKLVLVNELDRDDVQSIQYKYKRQDIMFVRGNFVKEDVLARANIRRAKTAVVLSDISGGRSLEKADERTIFGTMAIKSMGSKVRTCAELIYPENREHLARANVDEIIVRGESTGSLLATSAVSPGVTDSIRMLVNNQDENKIWKVPVPSKYLGRPFGEMAEYMRDKFQALVFALVKEEESVKLEDILSHDSTSIDEFIKRKFEESGKDFFGSKTDLSVVLNPQGDYILENRDWAIVISKEKPAESGLMEKIVGGVS